MYLSNLTFQSEIGKALHAERKRQGVTLSKIASKAYVSMGYLSEIERGLKEPSLYILDQLCTTLKLDLGEVLLNSVRTVKQNKELVNV